MWLPNYERYEYPGLGGKPYQFTHNPKGCMHTTEGGSISGAMSAYAPYPPHLIYDWRTRRGVQHVSLAYAAYSAMDGNDDDYMIQVELVGFAAETRTWPDEALRNIAADVVAPLEQYFKIPRQVIGSGFKDGRDGITLAVENSPIRLSAAGLRDFSGWLGHQHLPAPDTHWDPGALPMAKILTYLEDDMSAEAEQRIADLHQAAVATYQLTGGAKGGGVGFGAAIAEIRAAVADMRTAMAANFAANKEPIGKTTSDIEAKVDALTTELGTRLTALEQRLEGLSTGTGLSVSELAQALADEQDRRARDDNPLTGPTS